ncbi:hypothetical protein MOMA_04085 [Moraxella macacae 0408225]|uniref:Elongation factor P hydroxylase n=1 Tax=Moraxella macacae 0408225 TaxID=1230338 RepID=L2FAU5_9GAMM|nr:elongation factor P hydroxylase [Moraxella macacae]ELA09553.1 hypothetical protein MOMA_04085 [Moraxella macacae 0408225]
MLPTANFLPHCFVQPISSPKVAIFRYLTTPYVSSVCQADLTGNHITHIKFTNKVGLAKNFATMIWFYSEKYQVDWLIFQFNQWFQAKNTKLVRGNNEPEYFAPTEHEPAKIVFAHGFFASCLHEISHWCVAGKQRRKLNDFGYWYAPDGRNQQQQKQFEQVEIIPQAIECLLTLSCGKRFLVSQDNLSASFDTSNSTFADDVAKQAIKFFVTGEKLPSDAKFLISQLQKLRPFALTLHEIKRNFAKFY